MRESVGINPLQITYFRWCWKPRLQWLQLRLLSAAPETLLYSYQGFSILISLPPSTFATSHVLHHAEELRIGA
jgi:hypothetical protein